MNPIAMPEPYGEQQHEFTLENYFRGLVQMDFADDEKDMVNSPSHYTQGGIETIDYIEAKLTPEEFKGYLKGNIIKYTSRAGLKDEVKQEFSKAQWYIKKLIDSLG